MDAVQPVVKAVVPEANRHKPASLGPAQPPVLRGDPQHAGCVPVESRDVVPGEAVLLPGEAGYQASVEARQSVAGADPADAIGIGMKAADAQAVESVAVVEGLPGSLLEGRDLEIEVGQRQPFGHPKSSGAVGNLPARDLDADLIVAGTKVGETETSARITRHASPKLPGWITGHRLRRHGSRHLDDHALQGRAVQCNDMAREGIGG